MAEAFSWAAIIPADANAVANAIIKVNRIRGTAICFSKRADNLQR
jgi:hypothetical protein